MSEVLGGIGLFMVGMVLVTDGLRAAAGDSLRTFLLRFTGGTFKSILSGAAVTALVQSSSATTVATIGFVSAGLLSFHQALGLILGANIGTTATGWIVAGFGLKFSVSSVALPIIGIGALIRLFSKGRAMHVGLALAGFGIIFVGIDVLQMGMAGLSDKITPETFPHNTILGRLALIGIGVLLTTVMQSSSAAVTTAITALHSGALSLEQAAAMVIGINIGTTVTAGLAAIGTSTAAKQTAFAHLLFNALTGVVALATLPLFIWIIATLGDHVLPNDATILLAAFHTTFNIIGVLLIIPFSKRFSSMVTRVIRHKGPRLTRHLDPGVLQQGALATEAVRRTAIEITQPLAQIFGSSTSGKRLTPEQTEKLDEIAHALRETEEFIDKLRFGTPLSESGHKRHVSTVHALDHLTRLSELAMRLPENTNWADESVSKHADKLSLAVDAIEHWAQDAQKTAPVESLHHLHQDITSTLHSARKELLSKVAIGSLSPIQVGAQLEGLRWLEDITHHLWRLIDHLQGERRPPQSPEEDTEVDKAP